ncbi:MAG TPA: hypothetical protein VE862_06080 [Candidatus Acidoferrum sp.]|nr:hypothetical protein [Candidatus Acidoferrum sp.]
MVTLTKDISCSHCGAPLQIQPGEILITCKYCGFTVSIDTGKPFEFEHSLIMNTIESSKVFSLIQDWMASSFIASKDLKKKSMLADQNLVYLPFWVVSTEAQTHYSGILERISPPVQHEGDITNRYDWLVLARRQSEFPTRAYHLSLTGKIPFDPARIEGTAKVLNSEITGDEATSQAQEEIEHLHEYLAKERIDRIEDIETTFNNTGNYYLHAPVWFVTYSYKNSRFQVLLDGSSAGIIKGDLPSDDFKLI